MGKRIHTRIFCLVLAVILLLIVAVWLIFAVTSQRYVNIMADRKTEDMIKGIEELETEFNPKESVPGDRTLEEDREYSKELLKQIKQRVKTGEVGGKLLVFNSKLKVVYPDAYEELTNADPLAAACAEMIEAGDLESEVGKQIEVGGEKWSVRLFTVQAEHNVRAKYFIAGAQIPDVSLWWSYMGKLLVFIALAAVCIATVLIWLVAGSIARPLEQLCRQVKAIGDGNVTQIEDIYSMQELETLKQACNQMGLRIRESEREKERFFQNVSHDLRTPLASIIGYAQGIQCNVMKDSGKAAGIILSESMRMTNLVESILTLTKLDNHEFKLQLTEIDLEGFMEERLDAMAGMPEGDKLRMEPPNQDIYVRADPELLGRIVQNVLSNCIRYGNSQVMVHLEIEEEQAIILIEDDGVGFDQNDIAHVFERFYQGKGGKFGIGLSVVWSGMEYLGGKVEVGNRMPPKQGAFYRLMLPCIKSVHP